MNKAIVLLSGGQDSTTCLWWAKLMFGDVLAASIFYGQRHDKELQAAKQIAKLADVEHIEVELTALGELADSSLVDTTKKLTAEGGYQDNAAVHGLPTSFVPGRNLLFLSMAGALAVKHGTHDIVAGVCQTDYSGYPDCRRSFVDQMETTLNEAMPSSAGPFRIHTPLMYMTKAETVELARRMPGCWDALALSMTCYNGKLPGCGECPACELRTKGFVEAGEDDPAR